LAFRGHRLVQWDDVDHLEETVRLMVDVDDVGLVELHVRADQPLFVDELSPILYARYDVVTLQSPMLADMLDLMLGYIRGDCDTVGRIGAELDESVSFVYFALGNCALAAGTYESAVSYFEMAIDTLDDPMQVIPAGVNLAWAYSQLGEHEVAREQLDSLVDMSVDYPEALQAQVLADRAQLLALMFDYTAAIEDMDAVIALLQTDEMLAQAYRQRGDMIMLIYEWNRALGDYNQAIVLDAGYAEAYYRRGILYYTMVERENALADFEAYLALEPDGQFAEFARDYMINIQTELDALGG
jgi:tetratricopeptide (TPR) repeat protein